MVSCLVDETRTRFKDDDTVRIDDKVGEECFDNDDEWDDEDDDDANLKLVKEVETKRRRVVKLVEMITSLLAVSS